MTRVRFLYFRDVFRSSRCNDVAAAQAAFAALSLYLDRLRTGAGDLIDFSVLDGAMQALDPAFGMTGSAAAGAALSEAPRGR
ncbi:MAG TPA: hypothetical protein VE110_05335, partial [Gemmatimonadaceae bacterium]|nr:hypothetical protein [Gemmatimonadaceae bacterium]